jgi:hypothetical protein
MQLFNTEKLHKIFKVDIYCDETELAETCNYVDTKRFTSLDN